MSLRHGVVTLALLALCVGAGVACSPTYVVRAGLAESRLLASRRPLGEVILDRSTDPRTRGLLTLAREARTFARDSLRLDVGDAYTTYAELERDTLVLVLTAAYPDRLQPRTWWFPVVGHVPYRGYFDFEDAERERAALEAEGFDTWLRPASAFSTLGWFPDPLLSSLLRQGDVGMVETLIHELSHTHLFAPGQVRFNESFATFVGGVGAAEFFCRRAGGGPDTVKCARARARWRDAIRFSAFLDPLVSDLQELYADTTLSTADRLERREQRFRRARDAFIHELSPTFEASTFSSFLSAPLNNATLLSRMRYYHRLDDFQTFLDGHDGRLVRVIDSFRQAVEAGRDPFSLLPEAPAGASR